MVATASGVGKQIRPEGYDDFAIARLSGLHRSRVADRNVQSLVRFRQRAASRLSFRFSHLRYGSTFVRFATSVNRVILESIGNGGPLKVDNPVGDRPQSISLPN